MPTSPPLLEEHEEEWHEAQHEAAADPGPMHDEHESGPERREPQSLDEAAEHLGKYVSRRYIVQGQYTRKMRVGNMR